MTRTITARFPVLKLEAMASPPLKEAILLMSLCMTGMVTILFVNKTIHWFLKYSFKLIDSKTKCVKASKEIAGG